MQTKRILRYIKVTLEYDNLYGREEDFLLVGYTFMLGRVINDRKSTTGIFLDLVQVQFHGRVRSNIQCHFLPLKLKIVWKYFATHKKTANIFTIPLSPYKFLYIRDKLGLISSMMIREG